MSNDQIIEQKIQAKGLTAPRVTPADISANIADTEILKHVTKSGQVLRWAILTTLSGFAVVGKPSASVSAKNDDQEIGERCAVENSRDEMWPLMGFALKQRLFDAPQAPIAPQLPVCNSRVAPSCEQLSIADIVANARTVPPHQQRVIDERTELVDKRDRLYSFCDASPIFTALPVEERLRLHKQLIAMNVYADTLTERIAAF